MDFKKDHTTTKQKMKPAALATTTLLALAASSKLALGADVQPHEMWVAIITYKSKDALVNANLEYDSFVETPDGEGRSYNASSYEFAEWTYKCMTGRSYTVMRPADPMSEPDFNPAEWGMSADEVARYQSEEYNLANESDQALYKKLNHNVLDKITYEHKYFWLTDPETMKLPECQKEALEDVLATTSEYFGVYHTVKYEKVSMTQEELDSCVVKTETTSQPLCGAGYGKALPPSAEEEAACVACSVTAGNNSVIASTMIAGAMMIAASLFF